MDAWAGSINGRDSEGMYPYLVYLNRICRVNMHGLQQPARGVGPNGDCTQVKGPILLPYLLEGSTVASVASKPEAL